MMAALRGSPPDQTAAAQEFLDRAHLGLQQAIEQATELKAGVDELVTLLKIAAKCGPLLGPELRQALAVLAGRHQMAAMELAVELVIIDSAITKAGLCLLAADIEGCDDGRTEDWKNSTADRLIWIRKVLQLAQPKITKVCSALILVRCHYLGPDRAGLQPAVERLEKCSRDLTVVFQMLETSVIAAGSAARADGNVVVPFGRPSADH